MSRETRLLVVTITLSVMVLVLLSRFRFPDRPPIAAVLPAPLERFAARATYDELAAIVAGVQRAISSSLVVLQIGAPSGAGPRTLSDVLKASPSSLGPGHVPALRVSPTTAIAAIAPDTPVLGIVGQSADIRPRIVASDPIRRIALIEVPTKDAGAVPPLSLSDLQTPTYVVVVEGTRAGLSFRPLFIGSSDQFDDPRWTRPLLAISSVPLTSPGALLFSTVGQFLGVALVEGGALALADGRDIVESHERLSLGQTAAPLDAGIALQPLTAPLAAALGVPGGVVVADIESSGPADGILQSADVIIAIDGEPVESADAFLLRLGRSAAGTKVALAVVRRGQTIDVALALPSGKPIEPSTRAGMTLSGRRQGGSLVENVAPGSPADDAGLEPGDAIVMAGDVARPSPAEFAQLSAPDTTGRHLALTIEREGRRLVTALAIAPDADANR